MEKVMEKVKKLLDRANGNPFEAEAKACILKAQKLMAENNLSLEDVQAGVSAVEKEDVVYTDLNSYGKTLWWYKDLCYIIATNFRCYPLITRIQDHIDWRKSTTKISFLGKKSDVSIAAEVFGYALDATKFNAKKFIEMLKNKSGRTSNELAGFKNDYIKGFLAGLNQALKQQADENKWGIVLAMDSEVVSAYNKLMGDKDPDKKHKENVKCKKSNNKVAMGMGYQDGKSFKAPKGRLEEGSDS